MNAEFCLTFPITTQMHDRAAQFAEPVRHDSAKYTRIYRNTIAVSFMHYYLSDFLGIETDLSHSSSWDFASRLVLDVADLVISDVGTLECRTIQTGESYSSIPSEVWDDRIGYVILEISPEQTDAKLLGFSPTLDSSHPERLAIDTLESIDLLLEQIEAATSVSSQETSQTSVTKLSHWLKGEFSGAWQAFSEGLQPFTTPAPEVEFRFRRGPSNEVSASTVQGQRSVVLNQLSLKFMIKYTPEARNERIQLNIKVCPTDDRTSIPPDLQIIVSSGETELKPVQRDIGNYVEKQLRGVPGEQFKVQIRWQEAEFSEEFEI